MGPRPKDERPALGMALRLLSLRARSISEMRSRLSAKGLAPEAIEDAIRRLSEKGLLDDDAFSREVCASRLGSRKWGPRKIAAELRARGVCEEAIRNALSRVDEDEETAAALHWLGKWQKATSGRPPAGMKERARIYRRLLAKGFTDETIKKAMGKTTCDDEG